MLTLRQTRRRSRTGALLQLAVFFLLQFSLILPPVAQALAARTGARVCHGDHAECGCAPGRIAAGTCCCAIKELPSCCQKKAEEKAKSEKHELTTIPCGSADPIVVNACDNYIPGSHEYAILLSADLLLPGLAPGAPFPGFLQPPVPPPQHLS
jgi:hypothetical protein